MKHKHADVIKAWADGAPCQFRIFAGEEWQDMRLTVSDDISPMFDPNWQYRVKPIIADEQTDDHSGICLEVEA